LHAWLCAAGLLPSTVGFEYLAFHGVSVGLAYFGWFFTWGTFGDCMERVHGSICFLRRELDEMEILWLRNAQVVKDFMDEGQSAILHMLCKQGIQLSNTVRNTQDTAPK
jgi:hypothetical protein